MKTNKIVIILGLFLLPVLLNAQVTDRLNEVVTQITNNGVTFTISGEDLDSIGIVNIQNKIGQEVKRVQKEKEQKQLREEKAKSNYERIKEIYPSINEEVLQKIVIHLAQMSGSFDYFNYYDAKYYAKAELDIDVNYGKKPKTLTFNDTIFFFYEHTNYDEGCSWSEWMILAYDVNTGDLKYKHDFSSYDKNITLTNLLNPEEKIVYKDNFR